MWVGIIAIIFNISTPSVPHVGDGEIKTEIKKDILTDVALAFSGNGSYDCRDMEGKVKYTIADDKVKIETSGGKSTVIVKNGYSYTFNNNTKKWIQIELREGLAVPGSGFYPKLELTCHEIEVDVKEFNT